MPKAEPFGWGRVAGWAGRGTKASFIKLESNQEYNNKGARVPDPAPHPRTSPTLWGKRAGWGAGLRGRGRGLLKTKS